MIIGITGPARSGKDTVADYIIKQIYGYTKASFADPMKDMLLTGLCLTNDQLYGDEKELIDHRYKQSPRYLMQTLGTEWGRKLIHPDIWVQAMATRIKPQTVIPDVRFENEAKFVRERGILIHVTDRHIDTKIIQHSSEDGVLPIHNDYMIKNNGTLEELYTTINETIGRL